MQRKIREKGREEHSTGSLLTAPMVDTAAAIDELGISEHRASMELQLYSNRIGERTSESYSDKGEELREWEGSCGAAHYAVCDHRVEIAFKKTQGQVSTGEKIGAQR